MNRKGTFTVTLKANEEYVLNISRLTVKDGFVKVNWEENKKGPIKDLFLLNSISNRKLTGL